MKMIISVYHKIIKYIDENIKHDITVIELSKVSGYSQAQIYRIFNLYSPVAVMEYIRRKRLYYAANELYAGRNLLDIALDYGYETPAGFYKAFKNVFGCAPSRYKNNKSERNIFMKIDNVKNTGELNELFEIIKPLYNPEFIDFEGDELYSRKFWTEQYEKYPEYKYMLYAKDNDEIIGVLIGRTDGKGIVIGGDVVLDGYKDQGILEALFIEMEKRAAKNGIDAIVNGIADGEEEFYAKLGYTGKMLIQSEKHSVDELVRHLGTLSGSYEITGTGVYDGYVNQLWLDVSILDKEIKKAYEETLGDCWTQIIVSKNVI